MPQLSRDIVKSRAAALRARGEAALAAHFAALQGSRQEILVEQPGLGRTRGFAPVRFDHGRFDAHAAPGSLFAVRITGADKSHLIGQQLTEMP